MLYKINDMLLTRQTQIRKEEEKYRFRLSDETIDRHGTIIKADAWNLENYRNNPVVLYMHQSGTSDENNIIGKGVLIQENGVLSIDVEFEPFNEKAQRIKQKIDFGSISSTSVGFIPIRGHWGDAERGENEEAWYFDEVELLEASIVDIPSNPASHNKQYKRYFESVEQKNKQEKEVEDKDKNAFSHFEARAKLLNINL